MNELTVGSVISNGTLSYVVYKVEKHEGWDTRYHLCDNKRQALDWCFTLDELNKMNFKEQKVIEQRLIGKVVMPKNVIQELAEELNKIIKKYL